ncbi:MAG: valine--tRNA ligase [Nanoarchaeota archaeon]|nr:valine--tRNA ligase [Nanoarchaeota archaeon]
MKPKPRLKEKSWTKELEKPIYEDWKLEKLYKFNKNTKKKIFSIDTPPPYVNAPIHIGQATTYVLMDMFARFRRMRGYEILFPLGLDRNGLPIEVAAEKRFNIKLTETPREKFIEYCHKVLEESSTASTETFLRSGIGFNSWEFGTDIGDAYQTDSDDYRASTQETFIDLYNKDLIYEGKQITNYCPGCQTTLADAEVDYEELPTYFNDVTFRVKETNEDLIIGTTRPELISTCAMVIYNPKDDRYKHLKGKTALTPLYNKEVPIKAHPMADMKKSSGLVMMASMGDLSDIRFFREMNLDPVIAINKDGKMNENAGFLKGLEVKDARIKITEALKENNLLTKQNKINHRTPICERSKDLIEFIFTKEFYLKQLKFKDKIRDLVNELNFYAPKSRQIMLDWIQSISTDWPISRERYYATEVPVWHCKNCNEIILPEKGHYYKPWRDPPPIEKCPKCNSKEFVGDTRVFDTWMDSSISPLYILGYSRHSNFFKKAFPCTLRPSGKEIQRSWGYYTILRCFQLTNKLVFEDTWVNYHIVDEKGYKMSKSKGNIIDPKDVLDKFGAEPFRLWTAIEGNLEKTDFRCSFERIEGAQKTLAKLWNVSKFISMFPKEKKPSHLEEIDKWILNKLNLIVDFTIKKYETYDFHNPAIKIKNFIWETFASHYLELVKNRAYNSDNNFTKEEQASASYTLHHSLDLILKLLAPILPFITYKIYKDLNKKDIHFEEFPKKEERNKVGFTTKSLIELNSHIWKEKQDNNKSLKDEIKILHLPNKFKEAIKDIQTTHNAKEIKYSKETKVEF